MNYEIDRYTDTSYVRKEAKKRMASSISLYFLSAFFALTKFCSSLPSTTFHVGFFFGSCFPSLCHPHFTFHFYTRSPL